MIAARRRSRDSRMAVSGKPTIKTVGAESASPLTGCRYNFDVHKKGVNAINGGGLHEEKHNFSSHKKDYNKRSA